MIHEVVEDKSLLPSDVFVVVVAAEFSVGSVDEEIARTLHQFVTIIVPPNKNNGAELGVVVPVVGLVLLVDGVLDRILREDGVSTRRRVDKDCRMNMGVLQCFGI